jgi:hypothetical protein
VITERRIARAASKLTPLYTIQYTTVCRSVSSISRCCEVVDELPRAGGSGQSHYPRFAWTKARV